MLAFKSVTKRFGGRSRPAVDDLDLVLEPGETVCLIGASGSGKSTALRLANRLIEPDRGCVEFDGRDVSSVDPVELRRRMGYVIQSGGLFPHLSVERNIGLLCALEGWEPARTAARVDELLETVRLDRSELGAARPRELSGGQRQRVGVARALALNPPLLLMDEPFGALDPITRHELQDEFRALARRLSKTILFVTHDLDEAFLMGDRVALLHAGRVEQVGAMGELVDSPRSEYVERFVARHASRGAQ